MNFLQHEMLKAILLNILYIQIGHKDIAFHKITVQCLDNNTFTAAAGNFFMLQKQVFIRILQKCGNITCKECLVTCNTKYKRRILSHGIDDIRLIRKYNGKCKGAAEMMISTCKSLLLVLFQKITVVDIRAGDFTVSVTLECIACIF